MGYCKAFLVKGEDDLHGGVTMAMVNLRRPWSEMTIESRRELWIELGVPEPTEEQLA